MLSVRQVLAEATRRLAAGGIPDAARDGRLLVAGALGIAADRLTLELGAPFPGAAADRLDGFVDERLRFRPVAQILGRRMFWGRWFIVTAEVLDPRPETETLIAAALNGPPPRRILDLGTGSGAILLTLLMEWPEARGVGIDLSPAALNVAARNAAGLGLGARAELLEGDWWAAARGRFDLVVGNPPYIPAAEVATLGRDVRDWEPAMALTPGETGLEAYLRIAAGLGAGLAPGGRAFFEIGAGQGAAVAAIFRAAGFGRVRVLPDLDGRDRIVAICGN